MSSLSSLTLLNGKKARYMGTNTILMPISTTLADLPVKDAKFGLIFVFDFTLATEKSYTLKDTYKGNANDNIIPLATVLDASYFDALFDTGSGGGAGLTTAQIAQINQATTDNATQASQIGTLQASQAAQDALIANTVVKNPAITGATKTKITYDTKGLVTAGADATATDIINAPSASITATTVQGAIDALASRLTIEEAKSTDTEVGNLIAGGATKTSPVAITAASMPLSVKDGDYYIVQTAGWYDLTAIGGSTPEKMSIGDKIKFNAGQNKYTITPAGDNQTAGEVSSLPIAGSTTTIPLVTTDVASQIAELAIAIKTADNDGEFPATVTLAYNVPLTVTHNLNHPQPEVSIMDINKKKVDLAVEYPNSNNVIITTLVPGIYEVSIKSVKN